MVKKYCVQNVAVVVVKDMFNVNVALYSFDVGEWYYTFW